MSCAPPGASSCAAGGWPSSSATAATSAGTSQAYGYACTVASAAYGIDIGTRGVSWQQKMLQSCLVMTVPAAGTVIRRTLNPKPYACTAASAACGKPTPTRDSRYFGLVRSVASASRACRGTTAP